MGMARLGLLLSLASIAAAGFWNQFWSQAKLGTFPENPRHHRFSSPTHPTTTFSTLLFEASDQKLGLIRTLAQSLRQVEPRAHFVVFVTEPLSSEHSLLLAHDSIAVRPVGRVDLPWGLQETKTLLDVRSGHVVQHARVPEFHSNWAGVFSKLQLFAETDFDQLVVLDYDMLVQQPLSPLVAASCSASSPLCMLEEDQGYGNGGFLVIHPSEAIYNDLIEAFEALRSSGLVLKYAEQDFWNLYGAAVPGFVSMMQLPNNCPGKCGNFLGPFSADCYLTTPEAFPALHFCGAAKPTLCTRTDMPSIWTDFCASTAANKWLGVFYGLSNACGNDDKCRKTAPTHVSIPRSFDLAVRARHRAELMTYDGPTGGCCGATVCISSQFPESNCTSLGGVWAANGVNCTSCGLNTTSGSGTVKTKVDLSQSGLAGELLTAVVNLTNKPALPPAGNNQQQQTVLAFSWTLIVGGEVLPGGQLPAGKFIEILLTDDSFQAGQDLFIYRFDEGTQAWVNAVKDCNAATAMDPVFVAGPPPAFQVRICHLSDFAVALANSTDANDDKPSKPPAKVSKKPGKVSKKPGKATKAPAKADKPKKDASTKGAKDVKPSPTADGKKGKKVAIGVGAGLGAAGLSAGVAGLALWAAKRHRRAGAAQARRPVAEASIRV